MEKLQYSIIFILSSSIIAKIINFFKRRKFIIVEIINYILI